MTSGKIDWFLLKPLHLVGSAWAIRDGRCWRCRRCNFPTTMCPKTEKLNPRQGTRTGRLGVTRKALDLLHTAKTFHTSMLDANNQ